MQIKRLSSLDVRCKPSGAPPLAKPCMINLLCFHSETAQAKMMRFELMDRVSEIRKSPSADSEEQATDLEKSAPHCWST
jgi:hypothetical protein